MTSKKESKSFALPDVLRDLALLRVSQVRLDSLVPTFPISPSRNAELDSDLEKSYQFTKEARAAIRLRNAGKVEDEAGRLEASVNLKHGNCGIFFTEYHGRLVSGFG
ncbi:hypothetical protein GG344DRAFT_72263 [Lentinula edodes]|nr:hypothetical protein GG344DRAFT_72263 [Lentinula edodes]